MFQFLVLNQTPVVKKFVPKTVLFSAFIHGIRETLSFFEIKCLRITTASYKANQIFFSLPFLQTPKLGEVLLTASIGALPFSSGVGVAAV